MSVRIVVNCANMLTVLTLFLVLNAMRSEVDVLVVSSGRVIHNLNMKKCVSSFCLIVKD